jgi:methylmalonyl-CoA mutase
MSALDRTTRLLSEFPAPPSDAWRRMAEESLEGGTIERKLVTKLPDGIELQPIYTRASAERFGMEAGVPGEVPFTRGSVLQPIVGSRICQELPYGRPADFNQALLQDLNRGQNAVNLLLDVATRLGLDPDEAEIGEVGGCGLSIATVSDLNRALSGVDLSAIPLYAQAGTSSVPLLAMLVAVQRMQGRSSRSLKGTIASDPIGEWLQQGTIPSLVDGAIDSMADVIRWTQVEAPELRVIGIQANLWAEAGGTASHELAFGLASAVDYLRRLERRGVPPADAAARMMFTFSLGSHFFVEIAKMRAARLLWSRVLEAAHVSPAGCGLVCHGRSAMWNKTQLDPHVNLLRSTSEAFIGIVSGCESIHISAFDDCVRVPDDFSRRLARNTQVILNEECHLGRVQDPAGGSWYVETLTRELAEKAWTIFQSVEAKGGMIEALLIGEPQKEIERFSDLRQQGAEVRKDGIVGTNLQPNLRETKLADRSPDFGDLGKSLGARVARDCTAGDVEQSAMVVELLNQIAAAKPADRVDAVIAALTSGASLGEVSKSLGNGRSLSPVVSRLRFKRRAESFELLRRQADDYRVKNGRFPRVFLLNMGPRAQHGARADFSMGFFAAGGFEVVNPPGFPNAVDAVSAAQADGAPVVVICSSDDTYPELVPSVAEAIKSFKFPPLLVLAGHPGEHMEMYRSKGVDEFIHMRANAAKLLASIHHRLGL